MTTWTNTSSHSGQLNGGSDLVLDAIMVDGVWCFGWLLKGEPLHLWDPWQSGSWEHN